MKQVFDPGALNHRMNVEMPLESTDGLGGMNINWMPVATVWTALQPLAAKFRQIAHQKAEEQSHSIVMRFREDISSGWRLVFNHRVFEIDTVFDPDESNRYLICMVKEAGR